MIQGTFLNSDLLADPGVWETFYNGAAASQIPNSAAWPRAARVGGCSKVAAPGLQLKV